MLRLGWQGDRAITENNAIYWFRQDLRLSDNPAFYQAAKHKNILPVYILDDDNAGAYRMGGASRFWLHHALMSLNHALGGNLSFYRGNPLDVLGDIIARFDIRAVYWNRCYEPWRRARDAALKQSLTTNGLDVESSNGSLLWEPWEIKKNDGTPYKIFTPFYAKGCLQTPRTPLPAPQNVTYLKDKKGSLHLAQFALLPDKDWDKKLEPHWDISEDGAHHHFQRFITEGLAHYKTGRNLPAKPYVSRLSPYLHFGQISPHQLWHAIKNGGDDEQSASFCRELGWREFSYHLLYYHPDLPTQNLQSKFDSFPWEEDEALLSAWQRGQTGVPMVDAGMRELWQTGYMHNRVRMIVGSFLVKNLRLHWRHGERWFWDTLLDADLANNSASWQWIAGCGADAAPYFRIFNAVKQGQKFDPDGDYVRRFIPEIASLPQTYLFSPWQAPDPILKQSGITLGAHYPNPIIDLAQSRKAALAAFQALKLAGEQ